MNAIAELQEWYLSQCNGVWEHAHGVEISTLDNPGWCFIIDLSDTSLSGEEFGEYSYGVTNEVESIGDNWLICKVEDSKFVGYGGPQKLEEIINVFLSWVKKD